MGNSNKPEFTTSSSTPMTNSIKPKQVAISLIPHESGALLEKPWQVASHSREQVGETDPGKWVTYHLNVSHEIISFEATSIESLSASIVSPCEFLKSAILSNAAYVLVAHNYPSGNCEPRAQDKAIARCLTEKCMIMNIPLLDFVIVTGTESYSFKGAGLLEVAEDDFQPIGQDEPALVKMSQGIAP